MPETPTVLNVTQLTRAVRDLLKGCIGEVWVEGEISNHRKQSSGHQYFTLKDERSQISCVLFYRPGLRHQTIPLSDGMQVQVRGGLSVYEARGQYQINVQQVQAAGGGLLQARFEALKRKLMEEGLFDPEHKRALPRFPLRIGIVTSPSGAAIRDMLKVLERRAPWLPILVWPARVQGDGAAEEIARGVTMLANPSGTGLPPVDLIIVTRGGGSIEDLWAFNEEILARAIFASEVPVVSAVGHEIDFTIADFVADLRAPTPSAAAEMVAPDASEILQQLTGVEARLQRRLAQYIQSLWQRLDYAAESMTRETRRQLEGTRHRLTAWMKIIRQHRPDRQIAVKKNQLGSLSERMKAISRRQLERRTDLLEARSRVLKALSPQATLERGFSITMNDKGQVIRRQEAVKAGDTITTRVAAGSFDSKVE
ncbi:MAG: exodeoxyribonuclease VII large subunit [Chthoniobacteraceae bacterium]